MTNAVAFLTAATSIAFGASSSTQTLIALFLVHRPNLLQHEHICESLEERPDRTQHSCPPHYMFVSVRARRPSARGEKRERCQLEERGSSTRHLPVRSSLGAPC